MDKQIIELQTRLAFQENTIVELNQTVTNLQTEIVLINKRIQLLQEQLQQLQPSNIATQSEETPPPHY